MAPLLLLLLLLVRTISAALVVQCGNVLDPGTLSTVLRPAIHVAQSFLHGNCSHNQALDDNVLRIATWPTYANISSEMTVTLHLIGYGYGLPLCASDPAQRAEWYNRLARLTGYEIVMNRPVPFLVPRDYLGFSVAGAGLTLSPPEGRLLSQPQASTAAYGHFRSWETLQLAVPAAPGLLSSNLSLAGCPAPYLARTQTSRHRIIAAKGLTVVSDVDDTLRQSEIWDFRRGLQRTFLYPFTPWASMPKAFAQWHARIPDTHFHYTSDVPETSHEYYVNGLTQWYPPGTYDFRAIDVSTYAELMNSRYWNVRRLMETFPQRRFILLGDTSTATNMEAYGRLAKEYPDQVQCIILRNVDATVPANWGRPNLSLLPADKLILFNVSTELYRKRMLNVLEDIASGELSGCGGLQTGTAGMDVGGWWSGIQSYATAAWRLNMCWMLCEGRPDKQRCAFDRTERKFKVEK
ncbi:hypothetical protein LTR08_008262 [Meristemomyces frigidus]|nr:hypothetical protein LTR08_008262 [Meristemomyces frigidus]